MLVLARVLLHVLQQFLGPGDPLPFTQAVGRAVLQAHPGHDAQRPQRDPRGIEHLHVALGVALEHLAARGDQLQTANLGGIGTEADPGAMGGSSDGASQGLVIDVGHVHQRLADLLERSAHLRHRRTAAELGLEGRAVVAEQAAEVGE